MRSPLFYLGRLIYVPTLAIPCLLLMIDVAKSTSDLWPIDRPEGMPSIQSLEVMCGKDHMDVHLTFSQPFEGIVSSKGQHGDPRCVYVPPSTGQTFFSFRIAYARCGTKPDLNGQFYENTVVVQYDKDLLEVWDEAKRLRCEWFNDYEKTASKPPMVIADLDVIQLDFRGDNVDCWMEIQHGKGPWAPSVSGIVPLGSTLTLVVAINDYRGEFDMRVKSCIASDGAGHIIQLSDEFGCVLRPKMISRFLKARGADERASVITYAFFHAFKFPDALSVHIKCKVEICRHGCLDHCQLQPDQPGEAGLDNVGHYGSPLERKDKVSTDEERLPNPLGQSVSDDTLYEDIIHESEEAPSSSAIKMSLNAKLSEFEDGDRSKKMQHRQQQQQHQQPDEAVVLANEEIELDKTTSPHKEIYAIPIREDFPHGPRNFEEPIMPVPIGLEPKSNMYEELPDKVPKSDNNSDSKYNMSKRQKRSVIVSDEQAQNADVGVSGLYEVISEADLAFSPDSKAEAVTVFQGRIREEVVYGICMPVPGFSLLFVLVALSAMVSALVAGSLLYRYQMQKDHMVRHAQHGSSIPMAVFSNWMGLRILRTKGCSPGNRTSEQNGKSDDSIDVSSMTNGKTDEHHSID